MLLYWMVCKNFYVENNSCCSSYSIMYPSVQPLKQEGKRKSRTLLKHLLNARHYAITFAYIFSFVPKSAL